MVKYVRVAAERYQARRAVVGVVGMGYVGLPLALRFAQQGFKVIGFDIDREKVESLRNMLSYIEAIPSCDLETFRSTESEFTDDFSRSESCDVLIFCVPTPLNKHREPDLSFVKSTMESVAPYLKAGQLVCLESTTYPGTTREIIVAACNESGFKVGETIFVCYSPEREDPGNKMFSTHTTPKVIAGATSTCLEVGVLLYGEIIQTVVPVSSLEAAEMTKLLENIHRAVNIGLVNELKIVSDKMGIDIFEVIDAAKTKPFGFTAYYPGPGLGGHCIPIDPFYLTWKAREYGLHTRFIELAGEINNGMPDYVISKLAIALNDRQLSISGSKVLILGVAYKPNVDDIRESPALDILEKLAVMGGEVSFCDPHVHELNNPRGHAICMRSLDLSRSLLESMDAVVLVTHHDSFDYDLIEKYGS